MMIDLRTYNFLRSDNEIDLFGETGNAAFGMFAVKSRIDGAVMAVIATAGVGWDHVSVSRRNRCPNWLEMCQVQEMFFKPDEFAMQLHVPASEHVNLHPHCLHLWRPWYAAIPLPPANLVGPPNSTPVADGEQAREVRDAWENREITSVIVDFQRRAATITCHQDLVSTLASVPPHLLIEAGVG